LIRPVLYSPGQSGSKIGLLDEWEQSLGTRDESGPTTRLSVSLQEAGLTAEPKLKPTLRRLTVDRVRIARNVRLRSRPEVSKIAGTPDFIGFLRFASRRESLAPSLQ